jgi:hypothetical protein
MWPLRLPSRLLGTCGISQTEPNPSRGVQGSRHGRERPATCLRLLQGRAAAAAIDEAAITRRGILDRGEHCQAAKRAAADIEGHSEAAKLS